MTLRQERTNTLGKTKCYSGEQRGGTLSPPHIGCSLVPRAEREYHGMSGKEFSHSPSEHLQSSYATVSNT